MMGLGALLLMFSWFGFNLGSVPSYGNIAADLPLVAINTLAAIAGGILGSMLATSATGKPDPIITPNGGLAGAVAICSGVHLVHPLFAIVIGLVAGAQIPLTARWLERKLKLDDPCGVGPVHAIPGTARRGRRRMLGAHDPQRLPRLHGSSLGAGLRDRMRDRLRHRFRVRGLLDREGGHWIARQRRPGACRARHR